jgi:ATP-dependent protease ClpP protease subunit
MFSFFGRQWRGDAPFWLSVLVFSLLVPWIVILGGLSWLSGFTIDQTPTASMFAAAIIFMVIAAVSVWQIVGTWRATSKLKAPSRYRVSRWLGRTAALSSLLLAAFAFASLPANMASYYAEATDADWIGQQGHSLSVEDDTITVNGYMSWGLYDEFVAALNANPNITTVVLDSPGGHYAVGLRMGRLIRDRAINTVTTDMCGSACTFAFIGGNQRTLNQGARLGFHAMAGNTQIVLDRMQQHAVETLKASDVPDDFISRIFATPADDVWYPSAKQLREANVVTDVE